MPNSPGVFALGYSRDGEFVPAYLDRADADLRAALQGYLNGPFPQFTFVYAISSEHAYQRHCEIYHNYVSPPNVAHPVPPRDAEWLCPCCAVSLRRHSSARR